MEENRSFDHFFGFAGDELKVNGLSGDETNLYDTFDPSKGEFKVDTNVGYINDCDPDHSTTGTTSKIFGAINVENNNLTVASMEGFIEWENNKGHSSENYCDVMSMFQTSEIPVLTSLASEYAIMDRFFAAHPGQTWPNRMFTLSATSAGSTATATWYHNEIGELFPQRTIFDQVGDAGLEWRNYYNDTPWELFMESVATHPESVRSISEFWQDAESGNLPSFAWLNPSSGINIETGVGSMDQHPTHDVAAGEQFIKDVYESLRASPQWNETLFIITYDEHGGFYDHVPTPLNIPPPNDGETSYPDDGFLFDRVGVRIPTILVSPWIDAGTVISEPPDDYKPAENSEFDLTSIIATTRILLGMDDETPALTDRDAWSATFEFAIANRTEPRTDCMLHTPDAPPPISSFQTNIPLNHASSYEAMLPINDLQENIAMILNHLANDESSFPKHLLQRQGQVGEYYKETFTKWKKNEIEKQKKEKDQKNMNNNNDDDVGLEVVCQPRTKYSSSDDEGWNLEKLMIGGYTISTMHLQPSSTSSSSLLSSKKNAYCLDASSVVPEAGTKLKVIECNKVRPTERSELWRVNVDGTIKPFKDSSLCVTCSGLSGETSPGMIELCDGSVSQHFAYHGDAPGNYGGGMFEWGDDTNSLGVIATASVSS
jgi:phospholipase C